MVISNIAAIRNNNIYPANAAVHGSNMLTPESLYTALRYNYPKFFKMDKLCKWTMLAAEHLFSGDGIYDSIAKNRIGVAMATSHGCLDADKRYQNSMAIPSPALFVYTLPNIMLGEICIRHGFKGEQLCMVSEHFDAAELYAAVSYMLTQQGMDACLCGWADINEDQHDVCLYWVKKKGNGADLSPDALQRIYDGAAR